MDSLYSETPSNIDKILSFVITDYEKTVDLIFSSDKCIFYDACSFRYHSNFCKIGQNSIIEYIKSKNGIIIITRCILMELAGTSQSLNDLYIDYIKNLSENGINVLLFDEKYIFDILSEEYDSSAKVNKIFSFAVRNFNSPIGTVRKTIDSDEKLKEILKGTEISKKSICAKLFSKVKGNKKSEDDLGEELIGICVYMLLHLSGEPSGKFVVISDDHEAAARFSAGTKSIPQNVSDKIVVILSTVRLLQNMINEDYITDSALVENMLKKIIVDKRKVYAAKQNDISTQPYSFTAEEITQLITAKNKISIIY